MIQSLIKKGFLLISCIITSLVNLDANSLELSGFITSNSQKNIATKHNGYVEKIFVNEGDIVKKGQTLLQIDLKQNKSLESQTIIAMQQAQLAYTMNKNDLNKATLDYKRYKKLYDAQAISKVRYEEVKLKKENLEKNLEISKQQIAQFAQKLQAIEKEFEYLNIKANSKAFIVAKNINEGELAMASQTLLVIADIENLLVYLDVSEQDLKHFRKEPKVTIFVESLNLSVQTNRVTILPAVQSGLNNFRVKLEFKSIDSRVLPGMYVKVSVE